MMFHLFLRVQHSNFLMQLWTKPDVEKTKTHNKRYHIHFNTSPNLFVSNTFRMLALPSYPSTKHRFKCSDLTLYRIFDEFQIKN